MKLQGCKINESSIRITKKELEKWKAFYFDCSRKEKEEYKKAFFLGKADAFIELLKHFEDLKVKK